MSKFHSYKIASTFFTYSLIALIIITAILDYFNIYEFDNIYYVVCVLILLIHCCIYHKVCLRMLSKTFIAIMKEEPIELDILEDSLKLVGLRLKTAETIDGETIDLDKKSK